jgi:hypothetical protein
MAKKKDIFLEKFERKIRDYPKKHEHKFTREMRTIGQIIGDSISYREYGEFFKNEKEEENFLESLEICKDYELDCDAIYNLETYVFKENGKSSVNTTKCPSREEFKAEMLDYTKGLPSKRGFIYIAWHAMPLIVHYIGMTEKEDIARITELSSHKKLFTALDREPTQFTIIFPNESKNIKCVEASFIRIMKKLEYIKKVKRLANGILNEDDEQENLIRYDREIYDLRKFIGKVHTSIVKLLES